MKAYVLLLILVFDALVALGLVRASEIAWGIRGIRWYSWLAPLDLFLTAILWAIYFLVALFFSGLTYYIFFTPEPADRA